MIFNPQAKLLEGYARLLDVPVAQLREPGFHFIVTSRRNEPEWSRWVQPAWFFATGSTVVCSVSPRYEAPVSAVYKKLTTTQLINIQTLNAAQSALPQLDWLQCELLYYPLLEPPRPSTDHLAFLLSCGDKEAQRLLNIFDGGVFAVRNERGHVLSHAGIKDKGLVQEIAVGTESEFRGQGMGRSVVAAAVDWILKKELVPTYWPDSLTNEASYRLAASVGFVKMAEMLFCAYEQEEIK